MRPEKTAWRIVYASGGIQHRGPTLPHNPSGEEGRQGTAAMVILKRIYDPPIKAKGPCFLVERLWPRGVKKTSLKLDGWLKDVAPSHALRRWFGHDAAKWQEFRRRYFQELDANPSAWQPLAEASRHATVELLYSSRDREHNNAVALRDYLESKLRRKARGV